MHVLPFMDENKLFEEQWKFIIHIKLVGSKMSCISDITYRQLIPYKDATLSVKE